MLFRARSKYLVSLGSYPTFNHRQPWERSAVIIKYSKEWRCWGNIHAVRKGSWKGTYSYLKGLLKHWQAQLMWYYTMAIWQVTIHLVLWCTGGRVSTLCSCLSMSFDAKVGVGLVAWVLKCIFWPVSHGRLTFIVFTSTHFDSWERHAQQTNLREQIHAFHWPSIASDVCQKMQSPL